MFWIKLVISAFIVALVSELAKKYSVLAAILASLPLLSILAITWLYIETGSQNQASTLTSNILWAILPSLVFFICLPLLLKLNMNFYAALSLSCLTTFSAYLGYIAILKKIGIQL